MKKHERQERAFAFLKTKAYNTPFSLAEVDTAAGWKSGTALKNVTKYWEGWVRHDGQDVEVMPEFRRVTLDQFIGQSSQKRRTYANFEARTFDSVSIFEFLLPLSREAQLRAALDDLFFVDSLRQRLTEIGSVRLNELLPTLEGEKAEDHEQRLLDTIEDWFAGYSIRHVAGRFRVGTLRTRTEAVAEHGKGLPYLIDETTAVVTFIVPLSANQANEETSVNLEALKVREFFQELFVKAVIRTVEGEEEVWFLEDSPLGRKLHVFEKQR